MWGQLFITTIISAIKMAVWWLLLLSAVPYIAEGRIYQDIEDNELPTDEEVIRSLLKIKDKGQPEVETSLGLPTDEDSFNELKAIYALAPSGTHHFVSSSFPEVDSRGFHESVFGNVGDYYPGWYRHKRDPLGINSRGFHDDVFSQDFGSFHPMKRSNRHPNLKAVGYLIASPNKRRKRQTEANTRGSGESPNLQKFSAESFNVSGNIERSKRSSEVGNNGLHDDTFPSNFGDFWTMKSKGLLQPSDLLLDGENEGLAKYVGAVKRRLGIGPSGFHGDTFTSGFGDFSTMKKSDSIQSENGNIQKIFGTDKRKPEMQATGFHGDTFNSGFGDFWTMKKRRPEMDSSGFHGDTFRSGFGDFWTMKKRRPEMDSSGFHGDTFKSGFGDFYTMKRKPEMDSSGFHGDTFKSGFGDFWPMKKRRPEMDSSGFHGDTFKSGFGDFYTMKRKPEMDSSGFHGDTFKSGFGDFWPMKKRRPEMDSSGFHGDTFKSGFGDFYTMKRKPEMDSSGFHGDTFKSGFGDFWPMKKRRPEMDSSGFHGDTFKSGFGDFYTMKKRDVTATSSSSLSSPAPENGVISTEESSRCDDCPSNELGQAEVSSP